MYISSLIYVLELPKSHVAKNGEICVTASSDIST